MASTAEARTSRHGSESSDFAPDFLAHWVVKTTRRQEMTQWYRKVFDARVVHKDQNITFLSWDHEHHRLALIEVPWIIRWLLPLARYQRKIIGIDHLAVQFTTITKLMNTYERLKKIGIFPIWAINHGPTTSLYYEDPDGVRLEFQVDNFETAEKTADYFDSQEFAKNPIGTNFDPEYLLARVHRGDNPADLLQPGAGTPPDQVPVTNMKTINWTTL
ncbi:biphenyl-2,3-diol 1,2-dioxygenase [Akanthomyces lecanii RCEF 1005]|uniref:Biphenyl-2,3-diol 1,2-dioxygenase n=1 Tax=Akanthomyces lecanii RCEF 1005 TaxID=1081108 RepID=A0A168KW57_CORDF|nr:biphenyl-2,3-diol 1,2-dioxygenase [Akanthomyces lecanii RCEF 1005]